MDSYRLTARLFLYLKMILCIVIVDFNMCVCACVRWQGGGKVGSQLCVDQPDKKKGEFCSAERNESKFKSCVFVVSSMCEGASVATTS